MKSFVLLPFLFSFLLSVSAQDFKAVHLTCEYLENPIGIDTERPRLSYQIEASGHDRMQSAYQIRISKKADDWGAKQLVWDSGKQTNDQSIHIPYAGQPLTSRQRYHWQVKVWDEQGKASDWSQTAYWEMGMLDTTDWSAQWIEPGLKEDISTSPPAPYLRNDFKLDRDVQSARLYITAHGLYEAYINGKKVGDEVFTPGWTSYDTRLQYQVFDVTDLVKKGDNAAGVMLGDGWYRGNIGFRGQRNFYGDNLALLFQLEVTYKNGKKKVINSDGSWKTNHGAILFSDIYNGESYDARREHKGWTLPGFDDKPWDNAKVVAHPKQNLIASEAPPVRRIERLPAQRIWKAPAGYTLVDFGQNLVGRIHIKVDGPAGQNILIRHAEVLDKEGNLYTENLRAAKQEVRYTTKGGGPETYEPIFTFQGFRYISVEGYPGELTKEDIEAVVIHSDMPMTGEFTCSDPLLNQLQHNIQWGQKGNFLDVPTDCPQRDERLGWTGDAQAFARTAAYNMDVAAFFKKWLQDLEADQNEAGNVPYVVPNVLGENARGSAGWADAATIIPWMMYLKYGDEEILRQQYASMKGWVQYMTDTAGEDFLWDTGFHFGDWLFYSRSDDRDGRSAITDKYLIAQSFFAYSTDILRRTAIVLDKDADEAYFTNLLKHVKDAYYREYVTPSGRLVSGTQTAYVLALAFDLLPEAIRPQAAQRLYDNVKSYNNHLTTGFLGTPHLTHVLSEYGYEELAYTLLHQETYPSWLYPVTMGATTIWERWDGIKPDSTFQNEGMNSFNHYAYGAIGDWMYRIVAGIELDEERPAYKHSIIQPHPGGALDAAAATHRSLYGDIHSGWKIVDSTFTLDVRIPHNTTATIRLPHAPADQVRMNDKLLKDEKPFQAEGETLVLSVGSGTYRFTYPADDLMSNDHNFDLSASIDELMKNMDARRLVKKHFPEVYSHEKLDDFRNLSIPEAAERFIVITSAEKLAEFELALRKIHR